MAGRDFRRGNPDRVGFYLRACADERMSRFVDKCGQWVDARSDAEIIDVVIAFSLGVNAVDDSIPVASMLRTRLNDKRIDEHACIGYTPLLVEGDNYDYQSTAMARRVYLAFEENRYETECRKRSFLDYYKTTSMNAN
jgi:hypothetical protein